MKKLMITAALLCGLLSAGYSQEGKQKKTPEERAQYATNTMEKNLSLTADQKSKIYEINLERAKKMDELNSANKAERKAKFKKQKKLIEDSDQQLKGVLTTEQQKSYEDLKTQAKENMKKNRQGRKTKDS
jgi:periplasmic protein CpxP/Spy